MISSPSNKTQRLVDTDVLVDLLRGIEPARELILNATQTGNQLFCSVITRVELLQGRRSGEEEVLDRLFQAFEWIEVSKNIADRAGDLANSLRASHSGILMGDYLIAATAIEHNLDLWTRNVKHFPMLERLQPAY